MHGDEFWRATINPSDKPGACEMQYDGEHAELTRFTGEGHMHAVIIPAEMMDRLCVTWQQWRALDKDA